MHAMPETSLNLPQFLVGFFYFFFLNFMLSKPALDCKISYKIEASFRGESTNMQMWNSEKLKQFDPYQHLWMMSVIFGC